MIKTLDILDKSIIEIIAEDIHETSISMPVVAERNGKLYLASFVWSTNGKQRNVPKPVHICLNSIQGGGDTLVEKINTPNTPDVISSKAPNWWAMRKLCQDIDAIISEYNTTGKFPVYKYLAYLENMITFYSDDFYETFARMNNPKWNIDVLQEAIG